MNCYKNEAIQPVSLSKKKMVRRFLQHLDLYYRITSKIENVIKSAGRRQKKKNPSAVTFRGHLPVILSEKDKGGLIWQQ